MKKILAALTAAAFMLTLSACGDSGNNDTSDAQAASDKSETTDGEGAEGQEPESYTSPYGDTLAEFHDAESAQAFVEGMGVGWNLGNTLDPVDCTWVSTDLDYETAWGNPKTTKELIQFIKSEGFDTIRIPVTWNNHVSDGPDYVINTEWFDRVQQVVDWAIEEDMYVILNIHHEGGWLLNASTDYDNVMVEYNALWTQIADRFKNYDEHLIFESMNEIGFDDLGTNKGCELMNQINAEFTDLIRASGGNNDKRYLLLAGYWTDIDRSCEGGIAMPDDDRTILSVHYYSPSTFAIAEKDEGWGFQETWGTDEDFEYLDGQMQKLKEYYVDKGTPVIIGEFGSTHTNKDMEDVILYTASVIEYGLKYNMCPVWWDNGQEIDRIALSYKVDGMQEAVKEAMENGFNARNS